MKLRNFTRATQMTALILLLLLGLTSLANARYSDSPEELYEIGKEALDDDEYRKAARIFGEIYDEYPESDEAGEALYWKAFAYYRIDKVKYLEKAMEALEIQMDEYPDAATSGDSEKLFVRIEGKLAKHGDKDAHRRVLEVYSDDDEDERDVDEEIKIATLHALMNMNSKKAHPILVKILSDHDGNSAELREQALFILASNGDPDEAADILVDVARNDPDDEVRENAVFWLSQVPGHKSVIVLKEILMDSDDDELRENAVFALSQNGSDEAHVILRELVLDDDQPSEVREQVVFWLAQEGDNEDLEYLMELYPRVDDDEIREQIIFGVANSGGRSSRKWLVEIIEDEDEDVDVRENALFMAGQNGLLPMEKMMEIYENTDDVEMREQVLFVVGQKGDREALEWLITVAKNEDDPEVRESAIFWISQFDDSMAEDFLIDIINGD